MQSGHATQQKSSYNVIIIHSSHLAPCLVSFISFHVLPNMQKNCRQSMHTYISLPCCYATLLPCLFIVSLFFLIICTR
ncbi:hypothetical protein J3E69DRAFT_341021, partial [Trichoderma sp. SZMC 28015]